MKSLWRQDPKPREASLDSRTFSGYDYRMAERTFSTGANRDELTGKPGYEGFLSPIVLWAYGQYMHRKQTLSSGKVREPDNWQKGMERDVYMDSLLRHVIDLWLYHRGFGEHATDSLDDCLAGLFFNTQGYWFETLLEVEGLRRPKEQDPTGTSGALRMDPGSASKLAWDAIDAYLP